MSITFLNVNAIKKGTAQRRPEFREEFEVYFVFLADDFVWISS
jgi:hypothetical protein